MRGNREQPAGGRTKSHRVRNLILFCILAVIIWVPLEFYLSNNVPRRETYTVHSLRLPEEFDGYRVLHLSDLHEKAFGKNNETLLDLARKSEPDIIALTGDLIDSVDGLKYVETLLSALAEIAPVYYTTGNHEWAADGRSPSQGGVRLIEQLRTIIEESGAVWLDSTVLWLERGGGAILLAGLCDPNGPRDEPDPPEMMQRIRKDFPSGPFTLLLSHRYDMPGKYAAAGFDVVLSGHGHGGVIRLPFTDGLLSPGRDWFPKGTSGVVTAGGTQIAVSRGLGDTDIPRFLNRPQVLTVVLKRIKN